jgi:superfamily II DNA/RNA helicase
LGNRRSRFSSRRQFISREKYISKANFSLPKSIFLPDKLFCDLNLSNELKKRIEAHGYKNLTSIQAEAIPQILKQKDILAVSETGSGKTATFLIPMIEKIIKNKEQKCLILTPTRELATQIQAELRQLSQNLGIYSALVTGGASMKNQVYDIRRNPQFVIATPGRLKDLYERRLISLNIFNNVVLDEVDRMLDLGFLKDITFFISMLPVKKQSLFFSATLNKKAEIIANNFLKDPVRIENKEKTSLCNIDQNIVRIKPDCQKVQILIDLLKKNEFKKVLVFSRTKREVDKLSIQLQNCGFRAGAIHGGKPQNRRNATILDFRNNLITILVATDVASRGMDIPDISHVINYDEPETYDDYIHRVGRTGRMGNNGVALTFVV